MSQPYKRGAHLPHPGKKDPSVKEFWVSNPWDIVSNGYNLSAFERNRTFYNLQGKGFVDLSYLTGADSDGDGRCVVAGDFRNCGQLDLVVRQSGGGAIMLLENRFPKRHFLKVTLRGTQPGTNKLGIGSRLVAEVGGRQIVRELYPACSFVSQMPSMVHFGLGDASQVDRLTIRWPSGLVQELVDVPGDQHVVITEGADGSAALETVVPGRTILP